MKAIIRSRSIANERNPTDFEFLFSLWSTETDTFVASYGKFGPSVEDVTMLTAVLLFVKAYDIRVSLNEEDQKKVEFLNKFLSSSKYSTNKATYLS